MKKIYQDESFANELRVKGWQYAQNFTTQRSAEAVMKVYQSLNIA
jgi:hypothetical protein